jgi:hypothetical protein
MSEGLHAKNFGVCAEKVDEHRFLFGVELGADPNFFAGVVAGVEGDGLNRLDWFEVAGVPLRVGRLFGEAIQVGDEGFGLSEGFVKGKCALGPFLCILVIECQHMCLIGNLCTWMNKVKIMK